MKKQKLTPKEKKFVQHYTDENDKTTFGNGTQSALKVYNVTSIESAGSIANTKLQKVEVRQAIARKILSKEEIQAITSKYVESIDTAIQTPTTENVSLQDSLNKFITTHSKISGYIVDKQLTVNIDIPQLDASADKATVSERLAERLRNLNK